MNNNTTGEWINTVVAVIKTTCNLIIENRPAALYRLQNPKFLNLRVVYSKDFFSFDFIDAPLAWAVTSIWNLGCNVQLQNLGHLIFLGCLIRYTNIPIPINNVHLSLSKYTLFKLMP